MQQTEQNSNQKRDLARVYNAGLNLLARREHSCKELYQKLSQRFADNLAQQAVVSLQQSGLLSDERFAEALTHARMSKGYGPRFIAQELSQKGVSKAVYDDIIDEKSPTWISLATQAADKKIRTTSRLAEAINAVDNEEESAEVQREQQQQRLRARQKLSAFLSRRGFPIPMIQEALDAIACGNHR